MNTHNPKTRALVSAFRSGVPALRAAACAVYDELVAGAEYPAKVLMREWGASKPTAYGLVNERAKWTKSGRKR